MTFFFQFLIKEELENRNKKRRSQIKIKQISEGHGGLSSMRGKTGKDDRHPSPSPSPQQSKNRKERTKGGGENFAFVSIGRCSSIKPSSATVTHFRRSDWN
jgi:hypothetical protein